MVQSHDNDWLYISLTRGHILMASGRVPNTNITFLTFLRPVGSKRPEVERGRTCSRSGEFKQVCPSSCLIATFILLYYTLSFFPFSVNPGRINRNQGVFLLSSDGIEWGIWGLRMRPATSTCVLDWRRGKSIGVSLMD